MKVLAFGASSSRNSINKQLVSHATEVLTEINSIRPRPDGNIEIEIIDLNDYEMPIYSIDRENEDGIHQLAQDFYKKIEDADALIVSYAEHNGFYTSAYKNIFDWTSRVSKKVFQDKPMVIMSASAGKGGGSSVLKIAMDSAPHIGANVLTGFSVGPFSSVFDASTQRLTEEGLIKSLYDGMALLHSS